MGQGTRTISPLKSRNVTPIGKTFSIALSSDAVGLLEQFENVLRCLAYWYGAIPLYQPS